MVVILAAVLGFVLMASLGLALAGNAGGGNKVSKRVQALAGEGREERRRQSSARSLQSGAESRRRQIVRSLKEEESRQKKARLTIAGQLLQAGLGIRPIQFHLASAALGLAIFVLAVISKANIFIALAAGAALGFGVPRWMLGFLAKRRAAKFTSQFADAMDVIVRGIRSGLPVGDCLKVIARESPQPLSGEFLRLVESLAMGLALDQALERMQERINTSELRFFAIVMAIQQKTGGNLAEALANLSGVLRARKLMREKIKALSSEAVASAGVIGVLPPGVVVLISVSSPSYMMPMFTDPRGHLMLLASGIWMSLGIFIMRRMINFKM